MKKNYIEPRVNEIRVSSELSLLDGSVGTIGEELTGGTYESDGKDELDGIDW